jgi:hypothetical protein
LEARPRATADKEATVPYSSQNTRHHLTPDSDAERKSGRVQFDDRGQAVWAWAVQTGQFDLNASTAKVRTLSNAHTQLQLSDAPSTQSIGMNPYERVEPTAAGTQKLGLSPEHGVGEDLYSFRARK